MAVRSAVLARAKSAGGVHDYLLATVPDGQTWILKSAFIYNDANASRTGSVGVKRVAEDTYATALQGPFDPYSTNEWQGWIVAEPGDQIEFQAAGDDMVCWVSGAQLDGVAP